MGADAKRTRNSFIIQGGILALAGIISRIIGLVKRIPLTNIIGDEGNGFYSAANEIYVIMLLISSYSLPLAVSKLVSARVSKGQYRNANRIFKGALVFALISGGITCGVVFFLADFFAGKVILEPMSAMALRILAPAILIVAIIGVFRGYFQGLGTMMPTAVSQILEQISLVATSLIGASILFQRGVKVGNLRHNDSWGAAYGAAGGTIGTGLGALIALLFLLFVFFAYYPRFQRQIERDNTRANESYKQIFRVLLMTIAPVILSTAVYNISNVLDQRIYNQVMNAKGLEAIRTFNWGVYSGKYRVLINIPIALANAMCASIVPTLTAAMGKGDIRQIKDKTATVIRFTMIVSIPCAVGLGVMGKPIVGMLFRRGEIDMAANLLYSGVISVVFYSLSTLTNGVLQGINRMRTPVRNAVVALVIHILVLYGMLQFMDLNIYAVVYSNVIFAFLMCLLNGMAIRKYIDYKQEWIKTFAIPAICAAIMGVIIFLLYKVLNMAAGNTISTLLSIAIGAVVYFVLLIVLRGVSEAEIMGVPYGRKIVTIAKKIHLMP